MINETASAAQDRPALRPSSVYLPDTESGLRDDLRQLVMAVFSIEHEPRQDPDALILRDNIRLLSPESRLTATFEGKLLIDSETAFAQLDAAFAQLDQTLFFREHNGKHVIHAVQGRTRVQERNNWLPLLLLALTFISVLYTGATIAISEIFVNDEAEALRLIDNLPAELWRGLPYALSIMLILGAHELGHFFAARYHKLATSLPYFIPMPISIFGTLGGVIIQRELHRSRKVLLDVAAAGPLVGLIFAIPILFIGLSTSMTGPINLGSTVEGNSFLYALAKTLVFGRFLPDGQIDVYMNQLTQASWAMLLVTGINLIPVGQLDGGHVAYALLGDRARRLYVPVIILMLALLVFSGAVWLVIFVLLLFFGRAYAPPLDMITPLDSRRRWIAFLVALVLLVTFIPVPFTTVETAPTPMPTPSDTVLLFTAAPLLLYLRTRKG
jgi:membrane-associated protease RseP (regulator of RpoE activity)